jgi:hypothetical protein
LKSHRTQKRGKSAVHLVAEATAAFVHDLVQEAAFVADNLPAEGDVEILKGNCEHVGAVEGAESLSGGFSRPDVSYPEQVGIDLEVGAVMGLWVLH